MKKHSFAPRSLLLAGAMLGAFTLSAAAQQPATPPAAGAAPAAQPLPPGSPMIGRPDNEAAAKLAPVAPPPLPSAPDKLPLAKLKVPAGFNVEVYAAGMANARSLALGDKGTVFVGSRLVDKVYAIVNKDGKRSVKVVASGLYRPNGVAFKDGRDGAGRRAQPRHQGRRGFRRAVLLAGQHHRPGARLGQELQGLHGAGRPDGPHTASLGMRFYTGSMFPKAYKDAIFVARHGSWNKSQKQGGDIVVVKLNKDGTVKSVEPFLTGFLEDNKYVGRPVDVMLLKDGSLLVSDDWNGAVYRISYGKQKVANQ